MITKEQAYSEIVRVLRLELKIDADLSADTPIESLGLDSLQLMQLFVYVEQSFSIELTPDSTVDSVRSLSLGRFTDLVCKSSESEAVSPV